MPTTKEGAQRLLEFFIYGMLAASESLGNPQLFLRTVEEKGLRKFMLTDMPRFEASNNATEACRAYTKEVDAEGLFDGSDTVFRGDDDEIQVEIGDRCAYRRICTMRHDEGRPVHCIRAIALAEMLRIRLDANFDWKLQSFGRPCHIRMARTEWRES
ncbi:MAG: hypothetical protein AABX97_00650 [Candidatus Thermoplasmatota archaeon]